MLSPRTENLPTNPAEMERGIARIYDHFANSEGFTPPVRKFWADIREEELTHEKIFAGIRGRARVDDDFTIEIDWRVMRRISSGRSRPVTRR